MRKRDDGGYRLPENIDAARLCVTVPVPDDLRHVLAFLGQLDELGQWWTWERDDEKSGRLLAAVWREIAANVRAQFDAGNLYCEEQVMDVRQNPEEPCILEKTFDGETWVPFADLRQCVPNLRFNPSTGRYQLSADGITFFEVADGPTDWPADTVPPSLRPAPPNPNTTDDYLACGIAIALTNELERMWDEAYLDSSMAIRNMATGLIGATTGAAILFPGALIPAAVFTLLIGAAGAIATMIENNEQNAFDEAANERYRCFLLDIITGDNTFDHIHQQEWAAQIEADTQNWQAEAVARLLRAIPNEQLQWLAYTASPVNDLAACPCEEPPLMTWTENFADPAQKSIVDNGDGTITFTAPVVTRGGSEVYMDAFGRTDGGCFQITGVQWLQGGSPQANNHCQFCDGTTNFNCGLQLTSSKRWHRIRAGNGVPSGTVWSVRLTIVAN